VRRELTVINSLEMKLIDVVELRAQADASMPASNNNVNYTIYFDDDDNTLRNISFTKSRSLI